MTNKDFEDLARQRGGKVGPSIAEAMQQVADQAGENVTKSIRPAMDCSEDDFLVAVIDLAHRNRWKAAHFRPGLTKNGKYVTAVQGDGKGWTDLVLVRERIVYMELKAKKEKLRPEQEEWRDWIKAAGGEWYLFYPRQWSEIEEVLKL